MSATATATAATTGPNPYKDAPGHMEHRGWLCLGLPTLENSEWIDPTRSLERQTEMVPVYALNDRGEMEAVTAWSGKEGEKEKPVLQLRVKPPYQPVRLVEALKIQLLRDAEALRRQAGVKDPVADRAAAERAPDRATAETSRKK
jgi:hypothetical protein